MKARKAFAKLKRRQDDYDINFKRLESLGFHRPGSMKK